VSSAIRGDASSWIEEYTLSFLRRLVLVLLGLVLIALIAILLLVPEAVISFGQTLSQISPVVRTLIAIVAALFILALLSLQVRPGRYTNRDGLIVRTSGALADVSTESARERVLKAVRDVPRVVSAEAKLDAVSGKADIEMEVVVAGEDVNVPKKQQEIDRALRQVLIKQLGLQLANRPRVHIQLQGSEADKPPVPTTPLPREVEPLPAAVAPPPPAAPVRETPVERPATAELVTEELPAIRTEPEPEDRNSLFSWRRDEPSDAKTGEAAAEAAVIPPVPESVVPPVSETVDTPPRSDDASVLEELAAIDIDEDDTEPDIGLDYLNLDSAPANGETAKSGDSTVVPSAGLYDEDDERPKREGETEAEDNPPAPPLT
jgi:hypothetical protein